MSKRQSASTEYSGEAVKKKRTQHGKNYKDSNPALMPFSYGLALGPDQIRLMKLRDGTVNTKIEFELHILERGGAEYHALSYAWGSPVRDQEAFCNGQSLMITSNLQLALSRLRKFQKDTYLWVDGVCINQADPDDKSIQVRRMSSIYRDAAAVIVWLGEENDTTGLGIQLLSNLCQAFPSSNGDDIRSLYLDHSSLPTAEELDKAGQLDKFGIPSDTTSAPWQAAAKILDAAWFGRRWVLQEVTRSRKCLFRIGSYETTPEIILGGAYRILSLPEFNHALDHKQRRNCIRVESIVQLLRMQQSSWLHESMADILLETANFESTDPRDRIFAIVGCLNGVPDHLIDYKKDLTEVLTSVAMCESDKEEFLLSLLRGLCYVDKLSGDVPSWIPTWEFSSSGWLSLWNDIEEDAIDVTQMEASISVDRKRLQTRAIIFDRTATIADPTFERDGLPMARDDPDTQERQFSRDYVEKCGWLVQCERIATGVARPADTIDGRLERFLRCYMFGVDFEEDFDFVNAYQTHLRMGALKSAVQAGNLDPALVAAHYRQHCRLLNVQPQLPGLDANDETIAVEYYRAMSKVAYSWFEAEQLSPRVRYGRRFFASQNGRIGWVPQAVQAGDSLCVIFGFAMPFAIRKVKEADKSGLGQYILLGACYVHDHMDGEIFLDDKLERTTIEII
ncbi:uncharacterized protein Z520_08444 [Fonsecaea multimorphosa CBS 102226]|uniref:Heterokaryon incompatibility domain-containing protein n=1 Tax=Fonsecaea multimorphosa CBS 102226 TaxID=1442371 RepID=A0A0D2IF51_9EURO|nr:uncharacterized protein Z520_08444 [Fonsecaea multimorphosa CBS 102226]KIX95736.1 hypothetical protein Z520_08444 [Fonsecaea multimorphosa CBS 102226]